MKKKSRLIKEKFFLFIGLITFVLNIFIFILILPHVLGIIRRPDIPTKPDSVSFATPNMGFMSIGRTPPLMANYRGPTVTISGNVSFKEFNEGLIIISVRDYEYRDIATAFLPKPGDFSLRVPINIGNVFIEALNIQKQGLEQSFPEQVPHGFYPNNPIYITTKDIKGINISLSTQLSPTLMSIHKGSTVKISGVVKFKNYKSGLIIITARSEDNYKRDLPPNITTVEITSPGKYELMVPINIGKFYIEAVNIKKSDIHRRPPPESPYGQYSKNPVDVKSEDLKHIDITIDNIFAKKYN